MSSELQALVDELVRRVDAPTALEDRQQRMVVHSSQRGPIDTVRRDSILRRTTAPAVVAWFRHFGINEAQGPLRIPGDPKQGILGRLCVPVRHRDQLLGFLWLIDDEERFTAEDIEVVERHAATAALLLYQDRLAGRYASEVLRNLLSASGELRDAAARDLLESGMFPVDRGCVAIVVQPAHGASRGGDVAAVLDQALRASGRDLAGHTTLRLAQADHGVLVLPVDEGQDQWAAIRDTAKRLREAIASSSGPTGTGRTVAAIGAVQPRLTLAANSYRHARLAARAAAAVPALGELVSWRDLGVFRALTLLRDDETVESIIDDRVQLLLAHGDPETIETLATYLDFGCDAKRTAEFLHVHRGTLYYRLRKVEESTGIDLHDGLDRLTVHLGLKLAQLAGVHPGRTHDLAV